MTIEEIVQRRQIQEVLHFTTHNGLVGMLASHAIKSRARLSQDALIEHILRLNTPFRKDPDWLDFVNFSITRINLALYEVSANKWHTDVWWRILSFDPIVLTHAGVTFATTNNMYPSVKRASGPAGLEALFADVVLGRYSTKIGRDRATAPLVTTCIQAEALYPQELDLNFLRRIYVANDEEQDSVNGQLCGLNYKNIEVIVKPSKFRGEIE